MNLKELLASLVFILSALIANLIIYYFSGTYLFQFFGNSLFLTPLIVGFIFIGFDLTCRDYLHEVWNEDNLWLKMLILIGFASILTAIVNIKAFNIAIASFLAFISAGIIDTLVYDSFIDRKWAVKVNSSNICSSFTDSFLFISIAFGSIMPFLIFLQFLVKAFGGLIWSPIIKRLIE